MYDIGYIPGTWDLFHIGHLNIIKKAKSMCNTLICAVSTDELVEKYKNKSPIIPFTERMEIIEAIRYVDKVVPQNNQDKNKQWYEYKFDVIFVGDDLKGTQRWLEFENQLKPKGVEFIYFPYTKTTSSTLVRNALEREVGRQNETVRE